MIDTENNVFTGVFVPAELWLDESISALQKMILIDMLTYDQYTKSDEELAKFLKTTPSVIRRLTTDLINKKMITQCKYQTYTHKGEEK